MENSQEKQTFSKEKLINRLNEYRNNSQELSDKIKISKLIFKLEASKLGDIFFYKNKNRLEEFLFLLENPIQKTNIDPSITEIRNKLGELVYLKPTH